MPPLHAGRPSCRRAKRGEGRGAPPSPSGQHAAASKLRAGCGGLSREGGHVGDAQWTDAWPARPQRPAGPGGRAAHTGHRRRWAVAGSRPPEAGGTGLSPAQPALCRDRAGRRSPAWAASPHESSPRWPQPSLAPPSHSGRPRSLPLRGLPCPALPGPALPCPPRDPNDILRPAPPVGLGSWGTLAPWDTRPVGQKGLDGEAAIDLAHPGMGTPAGLKEVRFVCWGHQPPTLWPLMAGPSPLGPAGGREEGRGPGLGWPGQAGPCLAP